jgi:hypothetical protein
MTEEKKETKESKVIVVSQIPQVEERKLVDQEGNTYDCITIEEAMSEIYNDIKEIKKSLIN